MKHLLTRPVMEILDTLAETGFEGRVAGGAVRDTLRGVEPKDIDIATNALPEDVMAIFEHLGYEVIPTGLKHGTVTVMIDGEPFEITTLRIDTETDGRHAMVEFTTDWKADAARRDFTMNAMYVDREGKLYDFFNGQEDLKQNRVRFVGDAEERIREDYLRILRYFRFKVRLGSKGVPEADMKAIRKHANGLNRISGERIWMELTKILSADNSDDAVGDALNSMLNDKARVLRHIGLNKFSVRRYAITRRFTDNPVTLLVSAMHGNSSKSAAEIIMDRFKASAAERNLARFLSREISSPLEPAGFRIMAVAAGKEWTMEVIAAQANARAFFALEQWKVPTFPVMGRDLIAMGMNPGPKIGSMLRLLEAAWIESHFTYTKEQLLAMVTE